MKGHKVSDNEDVFCMTNGWLEDQVQNSSTMETELWRNAGQSAFQLQESMLEKWKVTKYDVPIS